MSGVGIGFYPTRSVKDKHGNAYDCYVRGSRCVDKAIADLSGRPLDDLFDDEKYYQKYPAK